MVNRSVINVKTQDNNIVSSEFFFQSVEKNSLVVLFPGVNYSCDRPLLYFSRKAALVQGNDVLCLSYARKQSGKDLGRIIVESSASDCLNTIRQCMNQKYKEIIFISKSLGTEIVGRILKAISVPVKNIFLTPIQDALELIVEYPSLMVVGTNDEIYCNKFINDIENHKGIELFIVNGVGHSLEVEDNLADSLKVLSRVIMRVDNYMKL